MADGIEEAEEITAICDALVINIGTLNERMTESMIAAGRRANALNHPVILDPVGAGASGYRTKIITRLLEQVHFTAIRGNISEIKTISQGFGNTKGVDADSADLITEENLMEKIGFASKLAQEIETVIIITGAIDIVTDGRIVYVIRNGHPMMSKITGTGCMLTAMTGAYLAANPEDRTRAAAVSVCAMGVSGEMAYQKMKEKEGGTSSMKMYLIDNISKRNADKINQRANITEVLLK